MILAQESTASLVASYLEAVGTIAAVLVALFLQVVLVRLRKPELDVRMSVNREDGNVEAWNTRENFAVCFFTVRVHARRERDAATHVRAFLVKVVRPSSAAGVGAFPSAPLDWTRNTGDEYISIPSGTWRRLTLLMYRGSKDSEPEFLMPTTTLPLQAPHHARFLLSEEGPYKLIFEISADGVKPTFWCLSFNHVNVHVEDARDLLLARVQNIACVKLTSDEAGEL